MNTMIKGDLGDEECYNMHIFDKYLYREEKLRNVCYYDWITKFKILDKFTLQDF
jgi:hypothetical protein